MDRPVAQQDHSDGQQIDHIARLVWRRPCRRTPDGDCVAASVVVHWLKPGKSSRK
jgi:hypothetical protein